jgi:hypothetical protein
MNNWHLIGHNGFHVLTPTCSKTHLLKHGEQQITTVESIFHLVVEKSLQLGSFYAIQYFQL